MIRVDLSCRAGRLKWSPLYQKYSSMKTLYLYTTLGCHLCEQCKVILWPALERANLQLKEVEIADDDLLVERYGVRIPVIQLQGESEDLGWPFTESDLQQYLSAALDLSATLDH